MPERKTNTIKSQVPERGTWVPFGTGWRQVYGSYSQLGVSVEFHDFFARTEVDWSRSFHPGSVEICLNIEGRAWLELGDRVRLEPAQSVVYASGDTPLRAARLPGQKHRFVTVELRPDFLRRRLAGCEAGLLPFIADTMRMGAPPTAIAEPRQFSASQSATVRSLAHPPVAPEARPLWHEARLMEWLAECLFAENAELFCHRQQRLDRERVEKVKAIVAANYETPPSLAQIATSVGMSPFYLSRTFSRLTGETIPLFLRRVRVERAAEMLRAGTHNVTEAAFAVGYSSLGHFAKAFTEMLGSTPASYAQNRSAVLRAEDPNRKGGA
jgi:AraC family transcriptional regulator